MCQKGRLKFNEQMHGTSLKAKRVKKHFSSLLLHCIDKFSIITSAIFSKQLTLKGYFLAGYWWFNLRALAGCLFTIGASILN